MAFDYTNLLEVTATIDSDFDFTNRAGTTGQDLAVRNTAGEWCLETNGSTTSSGTGPSAAPEGRTNYVYTESSTNVASSVWAMKRNSSFDSRTQAVKVDLIYNVNIDVGSKYYIEYATVASPNETTDWTILETIQGTLTDSWISDTYDFSAISTATLWVRIRFDSLNAYTNDLAFSTWREYGVDTTNYQITGVTYDVDQTILGSCKLALFKDNTPTDTFSFEGYTISDATTGLYSFSGITDNDANYCIRAWKDETPHVFDVTDYEILPKEAPDVSWDLYLRSDADKSETSPDKDLRLRTQDQKLAAYPTISSITGGSLFETTETNIVLIGTDFKTPQGVGKVELVNNSVYSSGTKVEQTSIDSWSDTSIQFDLSIGSFTEMNLWLFITNSDGLTGPGFAVQIVRTPTITTIEDGELRVFEKSIVLVGTYLEDTQGTGKLEITNNSVYASGTGVTQTIISWSDTQIIFDLEIGSIGIPTMWMWVTNDIGEISLSKQVTITGFPISDGLWKTSSIQGEITSAGLETTVFLIRDE